MKLIYTVIIIGALIALISGVLLFSSIKQMGASTDTKNRLKYQGRVISCGLGLSISLMFLGYLVPFAILNLILIILRLLREYN